MAAAGAEWLLVPSSADFRWLTGASARSSERLLALAVPRIGEPFVLVPRLEAGPIAEACPWLEPVVWDDHEDAFERLRVRLALRANSVLLVGEGFRVGAVLRLAREAECREASRVLGPLRAVKDADELAELAEASRHADQVVIEAAGYARPGMSEKQLGHWIAERFESLGDTDPWAIVASGPNSADPHHFTSDREIQSGEVLLLDLGASTNGYGSDITRTFFLGEPPRQVLRAFGVVDEARAAGIAASRAGVAAEDVDRAARSVIERAGLGESFVHRTGHGVGLEIHEPPYLVGGNQATLVAGMVHSVEPGVYLPGRFGIRIEDLVVVEEAGARRLNDAPRDLRPPRASA